MSLRSFEVSNYRAFVEPAKVELKELTLLFGYNNAGKSALARVLPLLRDSSFARRGLPLNLESAAVRGGEFEDLRSRQTGLRKISLVLEWNDPEIRKVRLVLQDLPDRRQHVVESFQRDFVWTDDQRLELLQSIRSGIPIGSILVWRTGITALTTVRRIGPHDLPEPVPSPTSARSYLLDGLQRLSTLFGCLRSLPPGASPFVEDEGGTLTSWLVGFDLITEQFQIVDRDAQPEPTWLPLVRLLDSVRLLQFQRGLSDRPDADQLIQRADALAETFRTYKLPVVPVVTEDLATATRTFERVNRQGTRMSELHMVRALTWRADFDLEERLAAVRDQLAEVGWESLEPEWILKVCKAALGIDIAVEAPDETSARLVDQPYKIGEAAGSLLRVARWLATQCGVLSPQIVPYRMQVVMLAEVMRLYSDLKTTTSHRLVQWFWRTTYTEGFSGITGGQTNAMLDILRGVPERKPSDGKGRKGKEREPTFTLPASFNPSWVRVKAIALRLAALKPLDLDGSDLDASKRLASEGPSALVPMLPSLRGCAARMFTRADSPLRDRLLEDAISVDPEILVSHAITAEAAEALSRHDTQGFVELRGAEIRRLEEGFYKQSQAPFVR